VGPWWIAVDVVETHHVRAQKDRTANRAAFLGKTGDNLPVVAFPST